MSIFTKITAAGTAGAMTLAAVPASAADYVLIYTPTGPTEAGATVPVPAKLSITTANTLNSLGGYDVLSIFGMVGTSSVTGEIGGPRSGQTTSPSGAFYYDNVFFSPTTPDTSELGPDNNGFLFSVGGTEFNLYTTFNGTYALLAGVPGYTGSTGKLSVTAVPEPGTWAMMLLGFGLAGFGLRYRRKIYTDRVSFA